MSDRLRICQVHNFYRIDYPSGENLVVESERLLLKNAGIQVTCLERKSDDLLSAGVMAKLLAMIRLPGHEARRSELRHELEDMNPNLIHLHNPWPLLTYDVVRAAMDLGIPLVQTLHNCRLLATDHRFAGSNGLRAPVDSRERFHLEMMPTLHGSKLRNWAFGRALKRIWKEGFLQRIDYICPTRFMQGLVVESGIPIERTVVKPNFVEHNGPVGEGNGDFVVFVGRLTAEKGIDELVSQWPATGLPLKVIGEGPLRRRSSHSDQVEFTGPLPRQTVLETLSKARFLISNSKCYESFGLTVVEALASGTPCLVPRLGALPEIIDDGVLGRTFEPGNLHDLSVQAKRLWEEGPAMRATCRAEYEAKYTPKRSVKILMTIYQNLLDGKPPGSGLEH